MKVADIKAGRTYRNRGAGLTQRKVLAIGDDHRPQKWHGGWGSPRPNEPGVQYEQNGKIESLYLSSFAAWAGAEVV